MFNKYDDEYTAATEYASINNSEDKKTSGYTLGIFNFLLLTTIGVMGYVGFDSFRELPSTSLASIDILITSEENIEKKRTDSEYLDMLKNMDVDNLDITINENRQVRLTDALNGIINSSFSSSNSSTLDDTSYIKNIAKEFDSK